MLFISAQAGSFGTQKSAETISSAKQVFIEIPLYRNPVDCKPSIPNRFYFKGGTPCICLRVHVWCCVPSAFQCAILHLLFEALSLAACGFQCSPNPGAPNSPKQVLFIDFRPRSRCYLSTWSPRETLGFKA